MDSCERFTSNGFGGESRRVCPRLESPLAGEELVSAGTRMFASRMRSGIGNPRHGGHAGRGPGPPRPNRPLQSAVPAAHGLHAPRGLGQALLRTADRSRRTGEGAAADAESRRSAVPSRRKFMAHQGRNSAANCLVHDSVARRDGSRGVRGGNWDGHDRATAGRRGLAAGRNPPEITAGYQPEGRRTQRAGGHSAEIGSSGAVDAEPDRLSALREPGPGIDPTLCLVDRDTQDLPCHARRALPDLRAGVWADCARTRQPVVHNDYQSIEGKAGYPVGHSHLVRHASVPILDGDQVVLILGVGNKSSFYDETDLRQRLSIGDYLWKILRRMRAEKLLRYSEFGIARSSRRLPMRSSSPISRGDFWPRIGSSYSSTATRVSRRSSGSACGSWTWSRNITGLGPWSTPNGHLNRGWCATHTTTPFARTVRCSPPKSACL